MLSFHRFLRISSYDGIPQDHILVRHRVRETKRCVIRSCTRSQHPDKELQQFHEITVLDITVDHCSQTNHNPLTHSIEDCSPVLSSYYQYTSLSNSKKLNSSPALCQNPLSGHAAILFSWNLKPTQSKKKHPSRKSRQTPSLMLADHPHPHTLLLLVWSGLVGFGTNLFHFPNSRLREPDEEPGVDQVEAENIRTLSRIGEINHVDHSKLSLHPNGNSVTGSILYSMK